MGVSLQPRVELPKCTFDNLALKTWIGEVVGELQQIDVCPVA